MYGTTDNDLMVGTEFDDTLNGLSGDGDDYLNRELDDDTLVGGMGDDILFRDEPLSAAGNNGFYPETMAILRFKTAFYMTVTIALLFWL